MSAESERELLQLKKRLAELSRKSYEHNIYTYTGFLSMAEQDIFYGMPMEAYKIGGVCQQAALSAIPQVVMSQLAKG